MLLGLLSAVESAKILAFSLLVSFARVQAILTGF
jgi:hypothetical protein